MDCVTLVRTVTTEMRTHEEHTQDLVIECEGDVSRFLSSTVGWLEVSPVKLGGERQIVGMSATASVTTH